MILGLQFEEQLPPVVRDELQQLISSIQTAFNGIDITGIISQATNAASIGRVTVATQPTLTAGDAGKLYIITDTNHLVRWTGVAWEFLDEEPGKVVPYAVAPRADMWCPCDGSATTYLKMGVTMTLQAFTTANINGGAAYVKAGAAYGAAVNAKVSPAGTGTGVTGTDNTGNGGAHTPHIAAGTKVGILINGSGFSTPLSTGVNTLWEAVADAGGVDLDAVAAHTHTVPALTVPSLTIGTIEMANIVIPMYFRR